jgi:thiamine-monophosphate kinase
VRRVPGEFELIAALSAGLRARNPGVLVGVGDDAAVLDGGLCATTDLLVEDVHFRRATTSLADLGWKALAVNVSDLAAMGAEPVAALVSLVVPDWLTAAGAEELYAGLDACAAASGLQVAGGDVSRGPLLAVSVTALGRADRPALRSGAHPGDVLCVTGPLGGSRAGLALLEGQVPEGAHAGALIDRHRRPQPRVEEGRLLARVAHAMLDVSDGLASDAARLAEASRVACRIDLDAVPAQDGVAAVAAALGRPAGWFAAAGGEDYELLAALDPDDVPLAGLPLTIVGQVEAGLPGDVRFTGAGSDEPPRGFDHLR